MAIDKVREYLRKWNKDNDILELDYSSATVKDAAIALKCDEAYIAKSLSFWVLDKPVLIVVAGDKKVDNSKFKKEFKCKAKMVPSELLEDVIGHSAGGVCPFAINTNVEVYLDVSLKAFSYVYPACGSSNSAIKLTISELEEYSNYIKWVDISK